MLRAVSMNRHAMVTAAEVEQLLPTVSRHLVYVWRNQGKLQPKGKRGPSPLYEWGDVLDVEQATRRADPAGQRRQKVA